MSDATFTAKTANRRSLGAAILDFFAPAGQRLVSMGERSFRYRRLQALSAMTDAQLKERGVRREDIVRHVFADVYYV